jgi:hypothetical protein
MPYFGADWEEDRLNLIMEVLKEAHHELTFLHGCYCTDKPLHDTSWQNDETELLKKIEQAMGGR